ncbi:TSC22 domain family protein 1 isoform X1 [Poeciliopsis prolifica]|uniref:TSC22 domain family protein 1 isoform X1 n=1 Tax=Poeciliopsis prolifica TaxID=188132 RepID=UPI0024144513|nr:TSC22 domain family protein 1 isoform X1 [Poeciliopsis prolifica]
MHHQDYAGEPPGTATRKAAFHYRRGSSSASGSPSSSVGGNLAEESPSPAQAGSSSTALQALGAQVKKKSGFQITSVTSAQINVSGNNSLADDTESYDDMDESHTEDLSSSEMLDVSASRPADTGVPERSSSDETLNSLHGVDTPGLVSPNEPLQLHHVAQGSSLVNGSVHHQYYPQQVHHHQSDQALPTLPVAPVASSSPAMIQRLLVQENPKPAGAAAPTTNIQSIVKPSNVSAVGSDNTTAGGQVAQPPSHSQAAPGSRFRVVKLDTNLEPFRKGRWTCTEYYEKEVAHPTPPEAARAIDVAVETEAGNAGASLAVPAPQQPYHPPTQDFTSPQVVTQPTAQSYISSKEGAGTTYMQKPVAASQPPPVTPQPLPYAVDPQPQGGYPTSQLHTGVVAPSGGVRQPDFIQPTAPFQTQVQPPLPHVNTGISAPVPGIPLQHPVSITPIPGQVSAPTPAAFASLQPQPHPLPKTQLQHPVALHGNPYKPLTALQADLQPLLTLGANLAHVPIGGSLAKNTELENAQKLLIQHQDLFSLPRLGAAEGAAEGHMGISVEARAFMAAAAFRSQHAEGEDDSSSGASVVAIDNKIEQAMDLVKSHLMYAVREEVEVLKEQIKELMERNTQLEQENNLLKTLASPEQMAQFQAQVQTGGSPTGAAQAPPPTGPTQVLPSAQNSGTSG